MSRSGRRHRSPHRNATRPSARAARLDHPALHPRRPEDEPLIAGLREALRTPDGVGMVDAVGMIMEAVAARSDPGVPASAPTLADLVDTFIGTDIAETTAALHVIVALTDDEVLAARIRRELPRRRQPVPGLLTGLVEVSVTEAWLLTDHHGDVDDIILDLQGMGLVEAFVFQIHHNVGRVTDAFYTGMSAAGVRAGFMAQAGDEGVADQLSLSDARARLEGTIGVGSDADAPPETDTWPASRPLARLLCRSMLTGGQGYPLPPITAEELRAVRDEVIADPVYRQARLGAAPGSAPVRLLERAITFAGSAGLNEPWRWSPRRIHELLVSAPQVWDVPPDELIGLPDVLRVLVTVAARRRGVPSWALSMTLRALDDLTPEFRLDVTEAAPARVGHWLDAFPLGREHAQRRIDVLTTLVGGAGQLAEIDSARVAPLPDRALDLQAVPAEARERAAQVDALAADAIEHLADLGVRAEYRAAVRALLQRLAARAPQTVRRGKPAVTAAGLCWAVGRANDLIGERPIMAAHFMSTFAVGHDAPAEASLPPTFPTKALVEHFGVSGAVSTRAGTLLQAAGYEPSWPWRDVYAIGDPALLTANKRLRIALERDRFGQAAVGAGDG